MTGERSLGGRDIEEQQSEDVEASCSDVSSLDLVRTIHESHASREHPQTEVEALAKRLKTLSEYWKYLSFVPIGVGNKSDRVVDSKLRMQLFNERGCSCEACQKKIEDQKFEIHHTNYYKPIIINQEIKSI